MLVTFLQWLQETGCSSYIRESAYAYPILLSLHLIAITFFGGMILVTDLRLLNLGLQGYSIAEVVNGLRVPKRVGFILAAACGALLFGSKAEQYSYNPWFWAKITLLMLISASYFLFHRGIFNHAEQPDRSPRIEGRAKLTAGLSLLLWAGVIYTGRGPATVKDIMHSMVNPSGEYLFESVQEIADEHGIREKAPQTNAEWDDVRSRLLVLSEAPSVLTTRGRMAARPKDRSKNPEVENEPEEVQRLLDADHPGFVRRALKLHDAATLAMKAVDRRDKAALFQSLDGIDKACESCHLHYWYPNDKRAREAAREDGITD
jgi:hypothetical protein